MSIAIRFLAVISLAAVALAAPALAQAPAKIQIVVFGFPSLGAFMPPVIKAEKLDHSASRKARRLLRTSTLTAEGQVGFVVPAD